MTTRHRTSRRALPALSLAWMLAACSAPAGERDDPCAGVTCSDHGLCAARGGAAICQCHPGFVRSGPLACVASAVPSLGGCPVLPADHLFNTPIDTLPVHPQSAAFMATLGGQDVHLDLGTTTDMASAEYYGIPYNLVDGTAVSWTPVDFETSDPDMTWDARGESDCAVPAAGSGHTLVSPCTISAAPQPVVPLPASPLVEGGVVTDPSHPYGDHHILTVDTATCRLWELYHAYPDPAGGWDVYGVATFDLASNALRPDGWTSADAAGFPILPLLLRADEASSGEIRHALRFTIPSNRIRIAYTWPARHLTSNGTSSLSLPPMGQLFRLKASYPIPAGFTTQSRAILLAMKTYGLYLADGGSALYVQGEPSAAWGAAIFDEVQSVPSSAFEAVDLAPFQARAGFEPDSARVPPP